MQSARLGEIQRFAIFVKSITTKNIMAIYDANPSVLESNGDGSYTYRWDIHEVEMPAGTDMEETTTKWECREVVVWGTVTSDKITEAVINLLWPGNYEQKLVNEYNAANVGIYGAKTTSDAQAKITAYKTFLAERHAVKQQIDEDCAELKIM